VFNLNDKYFAGKSNSETGEVDVFTIFHYKQNEYFISADYYGGEIIKGHLIGMIEDDKLNIVYHHINKENIIRTGECISTVIITEAGKIELNEKWRWTNGDLSKGESVVAEIDFTEINMKSYNSCAVGYHNRFSKYSVYNKQAVNFSGYLRRGGTLLDLGCGSGINSRIFSDYGVTITGVDISESMIALAEKNCPEGNFFVDDVRTFNSDVKYDAVAAVFCIIHLNSSETERFFNRIVDYLKQGSYLYISFMEGKSEGLEKTSFSDRPIYFNYYSGDFIKKELEQRGFSIIEINSEDYHEEDGSITKDVFMIFKYNVK